MFTQEKARVKCHKCPKRKQINQLPRIVDFEEKRNTSKMPRKNDGRRRGGGQSCRKSGEFKTCKEGANFVLSETVRQAKKKGDEEEDDRPGNNAEVRQLNGEVQKLTTKVEHQAETIEMLQSALIRSMSRAMYVNFFQALEALDDPASATEEWKTEAMTDAKHEGITKVVDQMIHMTHVGPERKRQPSKVAVEAFGGVVGFNDYPYEDMAFEEKDYLNDEMGVNMFQYRLFLECREIDWKKALKDGRDFHDYRRYREGRNYFVEKAIL